MFQPHHTAVPGRVRAPRALRRRAWQLFRSALPLLILASCSDSITPPDPLAESARFAQMTVTCEQAEFAAAAVRELAAAVDALVDSGELRAGEGKALRAKLDAAIRQLERCHATPAMNQLDAFRQQVQALIEGGQFDSAAGAALLEAAAVAQGRIDGTGVFTVVVDPASATITEGDTQAFTATLLDASGAVVSGPTVAWSSLAEAVAVVDGSGVASALAEGQAEIVATSQGVSGSAVLTVEATGGYPFGPPVLLRTDVGVAFDMAIGSDGAVYAAACLDSNTITVLRSPDGQAWEERSQQTMTCANTPILAVDDRGTLYLTSNNYGIPLRRSSDGGLTFGADEPWPAPFAPFDMVASGDGDLFAVGRGRDFAIHFVRSLGGGPFGGPPMYLGFGEFASVDVGGTGTLHVAWRQGSCSGCRTAYRRSMDNGTTWSAEVRVNDSHAETPVVRADDVGNLVVGWVATGLGGPSQFYHVFSTDDGITFSSPQKIPGSHRHSGRSSGLTAYGDGNFLALTSFDLELWLSVARTGPASWEVPAMQVTDTPTVGEGPSDVVGNHVRQCIMWIEWIGAPGNFVRHLYARCTD